MTAGGRRSGVEWEVFWGRPVRVEGEEWKKKNGGSV